jgi:hypothetical protein
MKRLLLAMLAVLTVLTVPAGSLLGAQYHSKVDSIQWSPTRRGRPYLPVRPRDSTTTKIAVAPPGTEWTVVTPAEWRTRAPQLVGKYVEVFGGMWTLGIINRKSSFSNNGSLIDSTGKEVGRVLFDQVADEVIQWTYKAECKIGCKNVFVRGIVADVSTTGNKDIELRVIEVSNESKTGAAAAGSAALAMLSAKDPDAKKPLLPMAGATVSVFHFGDPPVTETTYRNIRDTELNKIFANAPWNMGSTMWPRVAIIVENQGASDLNRTKYGDEVRNVCYRLRAKIWTGPAASQDVAPFDWCLTEMHYDTPVINSSGATGLRVVFTDLPLWGMSPKSMMSNQNTGPEVTTGPNPPYIPVPRFHYDDGGHSDVIMLGNLMRDMSFSHGVPDGRVWIVQTTQ